MFFFYYSYYSNSPTSVFDNNPFSIKIKQQSRGVFVILVIDVFVFFFFFCRRKPDYPGHFFFISSVWSYS